MTSAQIFQIQSTLIVALMTYGLFIRTNRAMHIKVMLTSIVWDVILILQIELSRTAILKASQAMENPMMLNIHVSFAVLTVLFYIAMIRTGWLFKNGQNNLRGLHKKLGWTTYCLRILTYITSFLAVVPKEG